MRMLFHSLFVVSARSHIRIGIGDREWLGVPGLKFTQSYHSVSTAEVGRNEPASFYSTITSPSPWPSRTQLGSSQLDMAVVVDAEQPGAGCGE